MLALYHIDAFTSRVFSGNSACVVFLSKELPDSTLLNIAAENAVAESAFILPTQHGLNLRWFTPDLEMDLCGHATLAAAFVVFNYYKNYTKNNSVIFNTCEGDITVTKEVESDGRVLFSLDFPVREGVKAQLPKEISAALNIQPQEVYLSRDYHLVYEKAEDIAKIEINIEEFNKINLGQGGVVVSAVGNGYISKDSSVADNIDFVSRFFTPQATILEDPVTGSAHCTLVPYWAKRLGKNSLYAKQISKRGGDLWCTLEDSRVKIKGEAICYMQGSIDVE